MSELCVAIATSNLRGCEGVVWIRCRCVVRGKLWHSCQQLDLGSNRDIPFSHRPSADFDRTAVNLGEPASV